MHERDPQPAQGLRERKKARTRETIVAVAMELFDRKGFDGTTIPEIAAAADVSPRTVSTYFPLKEEIVFEQWSDQSLSLARVLDERGPGETTTGALRDWIAGERKIWESREPELERQRRVIDSDSGLQAIERSRYHAFGEMLAESISRDMDLEPGDLAPRLAAAAMTAILDVLNAERFAEGPSRDQQMRVLDQGLEFVAAGVAALSGPESADENRERSK